MSLDWNFFEQRFPLEINALKNARSAGRLAHAFLLCSTSTEYRMDFPPLLAALAACPQPKEDFSPCGVCAVCRELENGTFPDLVTLAPSSVSRISPVGESEDEPDTMRWFEAQFYLSGMTDCGWKIGIVHEADRLNEQAQNAFLKTLEEPPPKCMFILTTPNPSELLPTIRSRCQTIHFTENRCVYRLPNAENLPEILRRLLFEAHGSLIVAEDCATALIDYAASLNELAKKNVAAKWADRLEESSNLESAGKTLLEKRIRGEESCEYKRMRDLFLSMIHAFFAQTALLASGIPMNRLPNPELFPTAFDPDAARVFGEERIYRCLSYAEDLLRAMRTNADDQMAIRSFCLKTAFKS